MRTSNKKGQESTMTLLKASSEAPSSLKEDGGEDCSLAATNVSQRRQTTSCWSSGRNFCKFTLLANEEQYSRRSRMVGATRFSITIKPATSSYGCAECNNAAPSDRPAFESSSVTLFSRTLRISGPRDELDDVLNVFNLRKSSSTMISTSL